MGCDANRTQECTSNILKNDPLIAGLKWHFCLAFIDDTVIFSKIPEKHLSHLEEVLRRISTANLVLKPTKCDLFCKEVQYLGHIVSAQGIRHPLPKSSPYPNLSRMYPPSQDCAATTGSLVGNFAARAYPLTALIRKDITLNSHSRPHR
eukprot:GHVN01039627.1.p1 GENE.GHVN01039627.1~~GHVN01039627.1.p1  ORF type:complete len:149 (-),score=1.73 GHVN01039627.1:51-497(-)